MTRVVDVRSNSGPRGIIGNKERVKQPHKGVYYFHDYPKKGSVALVAHQDLAVKDKAKDFKEAGFLRDTELRTAEVKDIVGTCPVPHHEPPTLIRRRQIIVAIVLVIGAVLVPGALPRRGRHRRRRLRAGAVGADGAQARLQRR